MIPHRKGRPKINPEDRMSRSIRLRMTEDEFDILSSYAEHYNVTKADLIRTGLACIGVPIMPQNKSLIKEVE